MFSRVFRVNQVTPGEKGLILAYCGVALFGASLAFLVVAQLSGNVTVLRALTPYDGWAIFAGAVGGVVGFYTSLRWMGTRGLLGLVQAAVGVLSVSVIGSVVAGTLALPGYGTMFGPMVLCTCLLSMPLLATVWFCGLLAAHFMVMSWRDERESIFGHDRATGTVVSTLSDFTRTSLYR